MQKLKSIYTENKNAFLLLGVIFFTFVFIIPDVTTPGKFDRRCWINWSNYILGFGLGNIYKLEANYLPLYYYILGVYAYIAGSTENIIQHINILKSVTLLIELLGVYYVIQLVKSKYKSFNEVLILACYIIFNPAFLYNNVLYGQVDGIYTTFLFISVYYGLKKKVSLSLLFYIIALNFKLQAITFAPLVFCLNLETVWQNFRLKYLLKILLPAVVFQVIILLPFIIQGDLKLLWGVVSGSHGMYPIVSMGAKNLWYLFFEKPHMVLDALGLWGRSYNAYGLLMFLGFTALAVFPVMWNLLLKLILKKPVESLTTEKTLLLGVLLPLIFFYFNTQMHSRYVHPVVLFSGAYALYTGRYGIFIVLSVAYFLNIEYAAKILKGDILDYKIFIFGRYFTPLLYLLGLIMAFFNLYKGFKLKR